MGSVYVECTVGEQMVEEAVQGISRVGERTSIEEMEELCLLVLVLVLAWRGPKGISAEPPMLKVSNAVVLDSQ